MIILRLDGYLKIDLDPLVCTRGKLAYFEFSWKVPSLKGKLKVYSTRSMGGICKNNLMNYQRPETLIASRFIWF